MQLSRGWATAAAADGIKTICRHKSQDPATGDPGTGFLRHVGLLCFGRFSADPRHGRGTNLHLLSAHRPRRVSMYR